MFGELFNAASAIGVLYGSVTMLFRHVNHDTLGPTVLLPVAAFIIGTSARAILTVLFRFPPSLLNPPPR